MDKVRFDTIEFDGVSYPSWTIEYEGRDYTFASYELAYKLVDEIGNPVSPEANILDQSIWFYLGDEEMRQDITYDYLMDIGDVKG